MKPHIYTKVSLKEGVSFCIVTQCDFLTIADIDLIILHVKMDKVSVAIFRFLNYSNDTWNFCTDQNKSVTKSHKNISWNWQYKDIYRKIMNNQHHTCILEAHYYLSVYNVYFISFIYRVKKKLFLLTQFCHCTLKSRKTYYLQFRDTRTNMSEKNHYQFIIIGAGVVGSSTGYHLTKSGASNVLLLEQVLVFR